MQNKKKNTIASNTEKSYYEALQLAFDKFIAEEKQGNVFTELRLVKAIEAARTLYKQ